MRIDIHMFSVRVTRPERVELLPDTGEVNPRLGIVHRRMLPSIESYGEAEGSWFVRDDTLRLAWSTKYTGVIVSVGVGETPYLGTVEAFTDNRRWEVPLPHARAVVRPVPCVAIDSTEEGIRHRQGPRRLPAVAAVAGGGARRGTTSRPSRSSAGRTPERGDPAATESATSPRSGTTR
jgi:hypothetical protein